MLLELLELLCLQILKVQREQEELGVQRREVFGRFHVFERTHLGYYGF